MLNNLPTTNLSYNNLQNISLFTIWIMLVPLSTCFIFSFVCGADRMRDKGASSLKVLDSITMLNQHIFGDPNLYLDKYIWCRNLKFKSSARFCISRTWHFLLSYPPLWINKTYFKYSLNEVIYNFETHSPILRRKMDHCCIIESWSRGFSFAVLLAKNGGKKMVEHEEYWCGWIPVRLWNKG